MSDAPTVGATETCFRIIEAIREDGGAGISDLARAVDLSKSAVYKHVNTLTDMGYLVREGDGYYLSNRFRGLGARAAERYPLAAARGVVGDLAETTGHVASFVVRETDRGVYVLRSDPVGAATGVSEGDCAPLHATAGGKAVLAALEDPEREAILADADLAAYTDRTVTDCGTLERELRSVRDRGVAFDREEFVGGRHCVAAPVRGGDGPVGAVSVAGPARHLSGKRLEEDVAGLVTSAATSVEVEMLP